jgi:hypothetical protein
MGWYADPGHAGQWRWWDGSRWTPYSAPIQHHPDFDPNAAFAREARAVPWALAWVVGNVALQWAQIALNVAFTSQWAAFFHGFRESYDASSQGLPTPTIPGPPQWSEVLTPLFYGGYVVFMVWQFRAARAARNLGIPAEHSPGLGVGSYFIPIVNLWFPYQALRDCLSPRHEARRFVLWMWLLWIFGGLITAGVVFAMAEARPLGISLLVIDVGLQGILGLLAFRVIRAIRDDHLRLLAARPG